MHLPSNLGEGNGNPLQYSCLENPMDRGAWWATVHGVTGVGPTEQLTTTTHLGHTGYHPYHVPACPCLPPAGL